MRLMVSIFLLVSMLYLIIGGIKYKQGTRNLIILGGIIIAGVYVLGAFIYLILI